MDMIDPLVLRQVPLFAELSAEELDGLAAALRRRRYPRGAVIFLAGDPNAQLYLIEAGRVRIGLTSPEGKEVVLTVLGPGDLFGDLALLDGQPRSASVVALEPVETAVLRRADFLDLLRRSPSAVDGLLARLAGMIRRLTDEVADLMFVDQQGLLAKKLLELAEAHGRPDDRQVEIEVPLSQDELAQMIGATRPRVNQLLGIFEAEGAITRRRRRVTIRDPEILRRRVTP
jgi:CRP/FNR family transcriptional regulator/CRP/FNR family cyclic AMP-dependent transcriptional regulator